MAKKKAASDANAKSPAAAKVAKPAKQSAVKKSDKPASGAASALTAEEIGHAAGAVWQALETGGPQTLTALKKAAGLPADMTMAGLGWLAREDKLAFEISGRTVKVALA